MILDGKALSVKILDEIKQKVETLVVKPHLAVILVGDDAASQIYVNIKKRTCEKLGITSTLINLPIDVTEEELINEIEKLNSDENINGILVQMPLPKHINAFNCVNKISPLKDVDGFTTVNSGLLFTGEVPFAYPCTPFGIIKLLKEYNVEISGKHAVVIGRSNIVGKPVSQLLLQENATVTVCHSRTTNLKEIVKTADIIVSAVGKLTVTKDMVKQGAVIVDVGIYKDSEGKIHGDVDFENVKDLASFITPVPGGVGPMTIAMLMSNTLELYVKQH